MLQRLNREKLKNVLSLNLINLFCVVQVSNLIYHSASFCKIVKAYFQNQVQQNIVKMSRNLLTLSVRSDIWHIQFGGQNGGLQHKHRGVVNKFG